MTKADAKILSYLTPVTDEQLLVYGNDTYFCGISKHLKNEWKDSCIEKVKSWVENHGGIFTEKSDWMRQRIFNGRFYSEKDGIIVQIIFPCYNKKTGKNMKEIMATLFCK